MVNKKLLVGMFLVMAVAGFSMSFVSAESNTYTINGKVGKQIPLQSFYNYTFENYGPDFKGASAAFMHCYREYGLFTYDIDDIEMPWIAVYYTGRVAGHAEFDLNGDHYIFDVSE